MTNENYRIVLYEIPNGGLHSKPLSDDKILKRINLQLGEEIVQSSISSCYILFVIKKNQPMLTINKTLTG